MKNTLEAFAADLAPFADLGASPPSFTQIDSKAIVRLIRNGVMVSLTFNTDGKITEESEDFKRVHFSFKALLASDNFSNLRRWANSQEMTLRSRQDRESIPVYGLIADSQVKGDFVYLDDFLDTAVRSENPPRTMIVLIDGPAGIGKTSILRALAYRRAKNYITTQRPLLLHVESRGRMLQNITDLMAFSLQTLRLSVTYDQIPILVKHGLIILAVDGFDELGDPNGYELAWAQVNDLVQSARGGGTLLFSGRETFISKSRMTKSLNSIDLSLDRLEAFNLQGVKPQIAKDWLQKFGWNEDIFRMETVSPLFEEGSYALRPFFLSELARPGVQEQIIHNKNNGLLSFLIESMVERESKKFGVDIESITTSEQRILFLNRLMEEVARDFAENQTDAISSEMLAWLSEMACDGIIPNSLIGLVKNRSGVIAFLTEDERRGYKRFIHEYVYYYFLSRASIYSVSRGELPKFIRRNILGSDFLEVFIDVCRKINQEQSDLFMQNCQSILDSAPPNDRTRSNISSLMFSACSVLEPSNTPVISSVTMEEAYISETLSHIILSDVFIGQLDARSADFRAVKFEGYSNITSLLANSGTVPPHPIPLINALVLPDETIYEPKIIVQWFYRQRISFGSGPYFDIAKLLNDLPQFSLLARIARYKQFWLKDCDERTSRKILDDPHWEHIKRLMEKHDLITERLDVPASGRPAPFYHFKNRNAFLDLMKPSKSVVPFLQDLLNESILWKIENDDEGPE